MHKYITPSLATVIVSSSQGLRELLHKGFALNYFAPIIALGAAILGVSCTVKVKSHYVDPTEPSKILKGIPYQLPSTSMKASVSYAVLLTKTINKTTKKETDVNLRKVSVTLLPDTWKVAKQVAPDSDFTFRIDPDEFRTLTAALPLSNDGNKVGVANGLLTSFNFTSEDKSAAIIKNLITTASNVALLGTGPVGLAASGAEVAAGDSVEVVEKLPNINVEGTFLLRKEIDCMTRDLGKGNFNDHCFKKVTIDLSCFEKQVRNSSVIVGTLVDPRCLKIESSKLVVSANQIKCTDNIRTELRDLGKVKGIVARYPSAATVEIFTDGVKQFASVDSIVEAGGFHHIPIRSRPFTKSEDMLAFDESVGTLRSYAYGREATAEKVSASAADTTGAIGDAIVSVDKARQAQMDAQVQSMRASAEFARSAPIILSPAPATSPVTVNSPKPDGMKTAAEFARDNAIAEAEESKKKAGIILEDRSNLLTRLKDKLKLNPDDAVAKQDVIEAEKREDQARKEFVEAVKEVDVAEAE